MNMENTKIIFLRSNNINHSGAFGMTINDIISDKCSEDLKRLICCDYQRPYTWKDNEVDDLIKDIEGCEGNNFHYIGILYFGSGHINHGKPIIDGQQRMITFFLILYYLRYQNNFLIEVKIDNKYYSLNEILEDKNLAEQSVLLNEYKKHMNSVKKKLESYFCDKDRNFKENFIDKLLNKLYFLAIVCTDNKMERALFIDINSKGIKLDDIDKIKAFLLSKVYKDDLSTFIKYWTILNKNGKDSINLFLKILMNALNDSNSSGKVKYEKFVETYKDKCKNLEDFKNQFEQAIQRFKIIPFNNVEKFGCDFGSKALKDLYASIHLAHSLDIFNTFIQDITLKDKFNDYINGKRSPIILFLLYILSYICELNFSFKNADSRRKITYFQNLNEKERKKEVQKLWAKCKNINGECQLDKVEFKIRDINDKTPQINEKSKCVFPLLILSLSKHLDFYDHCKNHSGNKNIDHIIPKKILFDKEPFIPKNKKSVKYKFDRIVNDERLRKLIRSIYNNQLMSDSGNKNKSDSLDDKFCIMDDDNKITGINYEKIKLFLQENKKELIKNLDKVIFELTK